MRNVRSKAIWFQSSKFRLYSTDDPQNTLFKMEKVKQYPLFLRMVKCTSCKGIKDYQRIHPKKRHSRNDSFA